MNGAKCLGSQIIAELYHCDRNLLDDLDYIRNIMLNAANEANVTIIGSKFHKFSPQGVSGVVVIAESHISIHTWPEYGYAALDIFTCGNRSMPRLALKYLAKALRAKKIMFKEVKRGVLKYVSACESPILNARLP
ncbi:MAG: adenosylmethionine decarboxylase [Nitrososphaerota archaeon]|nr:adenosylmethionine decarboxylase [Nitrososphaerota archaeon]